MKWGHMNPPPITLLTDFGLRDSYVGVIKGVIAGIAPAVPVLDLTHQIPPQDILAARFNLATAYPYFPTGTVHVVVVDPGVGSHRRAIALQLDQGMLVGPDNGVFSGVLADHPLHTAVELTNPNYWRTAHPSSTFHGRDIFAPAAAHLAIGTPLAQLGRTIDPSTLVHTCLPAYAQDGTRLKGMVQYIDHFGNAVTTIPAHAVAAVEWSVAIGDRLIPSQSSYADSAIGTPLALIGSHGWVEVAINGGSAQSILHLNWRQEVDVIVHRSV
ncbi:MAG: SAM-dependent chlorinase/fluorinase [Leptolyngbyaceae cyanobacterium SL_7_1]|nr:SAM-dependent chlorinase/fluorinase [Leptolyngbyaceae cyanobacterium SL_7_1]